MKESTKTKKALRGSLFALFAMHSAADRNDIRLVHRHSEHRREQDPGRQAGRIA